VGKGRRKKTGAVKDRNKKRLPAFVGGKKQRQKNVGQQGILGTVYGASTPAMGIVLKGPSEKNVGKGPKKGRGLGTEEGIREGIQAK